jgi:hypothetical protein
VHGQNPAAAGADLAHGENVLVSPAGPHQRARRSGSVIAAKTSAAVAGMSRVVSKVLIGPSLKIKVSYDLNTIAGLGL